MTMRDLVDDYDPVPGLVARGVMSNEHDPDSCDADCCRERAQRDYWKAKVKALPVVVVDLDPDPHGRPIERRAVLLSDVLALLKEVPDETPR